MPGDLRSLSYSPFPYVLSVFFFSYSRPFRLLLSCFCPKRSCICPSLFGVLQGIMRDFFFLVSFPLLLIWLALLFFLPFSHPFLFSFCLIFRLPPAFPPFHGCPTPSIPSLFLLSSFPAIRFFKFVFLIPPLSIVSQIFPRGFFPPLLAPPDPTF